VAGLEVTPTLATRGVLDWLVNPGDGERNGPNGGGAVSPTSPNDTAPNGCPWVGKTFSMNSGVNFWSLSFQRLIFLASALRACERVAGRGHNGPHRRHRATTAQWGTRSAQWGSV